MCTLSRSSRRNASTSGSIFWRGSSGEAAAGGTSSASPAESPRAPRPRASLPAGPASGSRPRRRDRAPGPAPPPSRALRAGGGPAAVMAAARPQGPRRPARHPRLLPASPPPSQRCAEVRVLDGFSALNPFRAWSSGACAVRLFNLVLLLQCSPEPRGCGVWTGLPDKLSSSEVFCVLVKGTGAARTLLVSASPCFSSRMLLIVLLGKGKYPLYKASRFCFNPPTI